MQPNRGCIFTLVTNQNKPHEIVYYILKKILQSRNDIA